MRTPGNPLDDLFQPDAKVAAEAPLRTVGDLDVHEIRRGGMGEILICRRSGQDDEPSIALKTFQQRFFFQPAIRSAFLREVRLWSRLSGVPHIMPVLGFQVLDGRPYICHAGRRRPEPHSSGVACRRPARSSASRTFRRSGRGRARPGRRTRAGSGAR